MAALFKKGLVGEEIRTRLKGKGMQCVLEHGRILHVQAGNYQCSEAGIAGVSPAISSSANQISHGFTRVTRIRIVGANRCAGETPASL